MADSPGNISLIQFLRGLRWLGGNPMFTFRPIFQAGADFPVLPTVYVTTIPATVTIPSVENVTVLKCVNLGAVAITNFIKGIDGQTIKLLGEGFTTVNNNANIKTNTGANKLLAANKIYTFTKISNVWYENE